MKRSPLSQHQLPRVTRKKRKLAQSPGSLVHHGAKRSDTTHFQLVQYDEHSVDVQTSDVLPDIGDLAGGEKVTWLHVTGLHETEKLTDLVEAFGVSHLVLEDVLNTAGRPKIEKRDSDVFVVAKLIAREPDDLTIDMQQLSMIILPNQLIISFLEGPSAVLNPVLNRIKSGGSGRIRTHGADYLAWALLDAVVDNYLHVIDELDESVLRIDDELQFNATAIDASELYALKRDIGKLYRLMRPIREVSSALMRPTSALLAENTVPYFTDLNDHTTQVIEMVEDLREGASGLRDLYLAAVSNRMNEVMKVLTCFSTIFLPLTFFAGVYGMNFKHMPELEQTWGYPAIWCIFLVCIAGMIWLFRRKQWL